MKEFDKIIKNKIRDADSPYPSDTWANIQKGLPKKKKRPYAFFLMAFIGLMLCSLPFIKMYYVGSAKPIQKSVLPDASIALQANASMASNDEARSSTKASGTKESLANDKISIATDDFQKLANSNAKGNFSNNEIVKTAGVKNSLRSNAIIYENTKQNTSLNTAVGFENTIEGSTNIVTSELAKTSGSSMVQEPKSINRKRSAQLNSLTLPSTGRVFGTDQSYLLELVHSSMKKNASLPCPTFVKKQNLSFIEFYFSNDYGIRTLSLKHAEQNAYIDKRNNTEFPIFSYSVGTRFGIGWDSGIAFKSGINYTQLNEKFVYTDPNSIQRKTITLTKYIYDNKFNVIDSVKTTEEVEIPGSNTIVKYNKYRFIDIPILFQYTFSGSKRLSYSVTGGPFINIAFSQVGKILSADNKNLIDISDNQLYKDNIGLSLYTAIAINYQLTKNTQIVFEPNIRFIPNTIAQLQNPIDQKYLIASIAAGFRYKI